MEAFSILAFSSLDGITVNTHLIAAALIIFVSGFLSGLSPCSIPTITLIIGYVSGKKNNKKSYGFFISLFFVFGITFTLVILGVFVGSIGSILMKSRYFMYFLASLLIFIGLWLLKIINIGSNSLINMVQVKRGSGFLGAFLLGLPFGIVASPCTMPVTIAVLTYAAAKGNAIYGMIFMFIFAIGRSIPILITGTFAGLLKQIKFLSKYEKSIERIGGGLLILIGFYLIIKQAP